MLLLLILGVNMTSASEVDDVLNQTQIEDTPLEVDDNLQQENLLKQENLQDSLEANDDTIVVENWDELQYYCSLKDKDYTLKLKENTNYYPTKPSDPNYQIKVYNNVKIIGSYGSYFGDISSNPSMIKYTAIVVPDGYKSSIHLENITFKWIYTVSQPDGLFIQMGGNYASVIKNCNFTNVNVDYGHASIVYLKKGSASLENCSFVKCTSGYGVVSVYDHNSVKDVKMIVRECYFEGNYATTAPGCINNCGILEVYNSTFYKNRAFWWAGAIHTHNGGNTTIYDSNFTDNVAGWNGGALYTYSYLQIYNTIFSGNNCTTNNGGGAIGACQYQSNPHIYIEKCLFENNVNNCWALDELSTSGTGRGGAISLMDAGSIEVRDTTFIANAASIGTAICAIEVGSYGSPDIIIVNNSFINHTRLGDVLNVRVDGTILNISDNYFYGNSIVFDNLGLETLEVDKDYATLKVTSSIKNPSYYDSDILDKTLYDIYVNDKYVKTVDSSVFRVDFDDWDTCDVYVIPTISNQKSNSVHLISTREYIFVSSKGSDENNGVSRDTPVNSIKRALELAGECQSIILLDGFYDEGELVVGYDLLIKGESDATLTNTTHFTVNSNQFIVKNMKVSNLTSSVFINQENGNLTVENCVITDNHDSVLFSSKNTTILKSLILNNNVVIDNKGFALVRNSVLINNTKFIDNNVVNIDLDYNWWGNTLDNISKPAELNINNWLILNLTSSLDALELDQSARLQFNIFLIEDNKITKYNDLKRFNLDVSCKNSTVNKNSISYDSSIIYTQSEVSDSVLTVRFNDVVITKSFKFLKSNPNIGIKFSNIMYNDDLIITVTAPEDITGDISVSVGGETTVKPLSNGVKFTFKYFTASKYDIAVKYDGNGKYLAQTINSEVTVSKYASQTSVSVGAVNVDEDIIITVTTSRGTAGTVNLSINDMVSEVLSLTNCEATYTFKNVGRGDYIIKAHYNGNERFLESESSYFLEVDNQDPVISVHINDTNYGETGIVEIDLNDETASGEVTVIVDGITNSSKLVNGKAKVYLSGADAGVNKNVTVFYSGDDTYFNKTVNASMTIFKNNFTFEISSEDIYIGHDAVITIIVPSRTSGNFTINDVVLSIPLSGEVTYVIPDLGVGNYTITAEYNGNNYFTVRNSTSFTVFEYPHAQWSNDGADTQNTQKTDYAAGSDGDVSWNKQINSTVITNIVIDSEGNLYIATTTGIYSYDADGSLRWIYESDGRIGNFSGLSLGRDVIISPRAGDTIYLIRNTLNLVNQTTGEKYGDSNIYQASSIFVPVIDSNANIYTVSEYQFEAQGYNLVITPFKIWEGGGSPIQISMGTVKPIAAPSFNSDVIAVLCEGTLMIIDADTLKVTSMKTGNFKNVRPVIGDGNVIYTIVGDSVYAFSTSGASLWNNKIPGGSGNHLLLDNDLGLYVTNAEGKLYMFDLFTHEASLISDLSITSGILIDADHNIYFGCDNMFYAIDSTGKVLWKSDLGSKVTGNPVMNKNGTIYVTTQDNKLFALGNSTGVVNDTNSSSDTNSTPESGTNSTPSNVNPSNGGGNSGTSSTTKVVKKASKITAKKKTFKKSLKTKKYTVTLKSGKTPIKKVKLIIKIGRKTFKATTNSKGKATFKIKKLTKKGKYTAKITFKGNKYYKATTKKVKIVLK